jgi:cation transport protein ChaC
MWVFGYGSLMWDGWEKSHGATRSTSASLVGFHRDFNKASTSNWGTSTNRGPTLGLTPCAPAKCEGIAFEFPNAVRDELMDYLRKREGRSFELRELDVDLQSGEQVKALVPVNDPTTRTYIGNLSLAERARMCKRARGTCGACVSYVENIHTHLRKMGIVDAAVDAFWNAVSAVTITDGT